MIAAEEIAPARTAPLEDVYAVHDAGYVQRFLDGSLDPKVKQRSGFPWFEEMVMRSLGSVGSTLAAVEAALVDGIAGSRAGRTTRTATSAPATAASMTSRSRRVLDRGTVARVLVFDVDVHQGDGTASIFADDPRVYTCSLHGERNFPSRKMESDLDVPRADGTNDDAYLAALERALEEARPDIVLYQGGVDVIAEDRLGRLALSREGCEERNRRALARFRAEGLPVALTLGGGYADPIDASIDAYVGTYGAAVEVETSRRPAGS